MHQIVNGTQIQLSEVMKLLSQTYWAKDRSEETMERAMQNSICYGILGEKQSLIGFARVITDFATTAYLCDVVIDETRRGQGLGKQLVEHITQDEKIRDLYMILITATAEKLYSQFDFNPSGELFMHKRPRQNQKHRLTSE